MTFAQSQFESAMYSHGSIFKHFLGASPLAVASCCASRVDDDPIWFSYQDDCYKVNLLALPRSVLIAAAHLIAEVILTHFCRQQSMLSAMHTDVLLDHLSSRSVPLGCARFRSTILAAEFQALYGGTLASALRTPPSLHTYFDMDTAALKVSDAMSFPWICALRHDLTRKLEKLSRADIQTCLDNLLSPLRSVSKMRSH